MIKLVFHLLKYLIYFCFRLGYINNESKTLRMKSHGYLAMKHHYSIIVTCVIAQYVVIVTVSSLACIVCFQNKNLTKNIKWIIYKTSLCHVKIASLHEKYFDFH